MQRQWFNKQWPLLGIVQCQDDTLTEMRAYRCVQQPQRTTNNPHSPHAHASRSHGENGPVRGVKVCLPESKARSESCQYRPAAQRCWKGATCHRAEPQV